MGEEDKMNRSENPSMRKSRVGNRYFKIDPGYDKAVYENTFWNICLIAFAFIIFYSCWGIFFWGCYSHGIRDVNGASILYIIVFGITALLIAVMIFVGHFTNKMIAKHDRILLELNEEKKKRKEEDERKRKREEALKEMKKAEAHAMDESNESSEANEENSGDENEQSDEDETPESR